MRDAEIARGLKDFPMIEMNRERDGYLICNAFWMVRVPLDTAILRDRLTFPNLPTKAGHVAPMPERKQAKPFTLSDQWDRYTTGQAVPIIATAAVLTSGFKDAQARLFRRTTVAIDPSAALDAFVIVSTRYIDMLCDKGETFGSFTYRAALLDGATHGKPHVIVGRSTIDFAVIMPMVMFSIPECAALWSAAVPVTEAEAA